MRTFVIADGSKRKSKPIGFVRWEPDPRCEQGRFTVELAPWCGEDNVPLSLLPFVGGASNRSNADEGGEWVRSRIVPEDRHNIAAVLRANGLTRYDEVGLLAASKGRSSDDDYLVYEVEGAVADRGESVENLLMHVQRRGSGSEVTYALVELPPVDATPRDCRSVPSESSAARRIGASVRERRLAAGLTQKQLASRARITQTVVSRVESGKGNPTLALLEDLASALGTSLEVSLGKNVPEHELP